MTAAILSGKDVASIKKNELAQRVRSHLLQGHRTPGLAVILIGSDAASSIYVTHKRKACEEIGIRSFAYNLPETTSQTELIQLLDQLNHSNEVDGILLQLPVPKHMDASFLLEQIHPTKDVDGFHPYNLGRLAQKHPLLRPCTPMGIIQLLKHYQIPIQGKHAAVIGASNIVGRPMSLELLLEGATVTTCHRFTRNLSQVVAIADLIIVATGVIDVVPADWLKKNQIVVDVGIHRLANGEIRGDIDFSKAKDIVSWITPVPGGVGPMTIISLLENTLSAARVA